METETGSVDDETGSVETGAVDGEGLEDGTGVGGGATGRSENRDFFLGGGRVEEGRVEDEEERSPFCFFASKPSSPSSSSANEGRRTFFRTTSSSESESSPNADGLDGTGWTGVAADEAGLLRVLRFFFFPNATFTFPGFWNEGGGGGGSKEGGEAVCVLGVEAEGGSKEGVSAVCVLGGSAEGVEAEGGAVEGGAGAGGAADKEAAFHAASFAFLSIGLRRWRLERGGRTIDEVERS